MNNNNDSLDLASIRAKLSQEQGKTFWRSLEEIAEAPDFQDFLQREFPRQATEWIDSFSRRNFLKVMGASLALAGLSACSYMPSEKIIPYVRPPEEIVAGKPLFFATAMPMMGVATGILAESHMGRPTKIEGNPEHPASLGASNIFLQASVLTLYDPDRAQNITYLGETASWAAFLGMVSTDLQERKKKNGAGLRFLTENTTSPTFASQMKAVLAAYPEAKWHQYEPVNTDNNRNGAKQAFGEVVNTIYNVAKADVIISLGSDLLCYGPGHIRYARDFANRRRSSEAKPVRLYVVETTFTNTGAVADHRLPIRASEMETFARALANGLGVQNAGGASVNPSQTKWLDALIKDLQQHSGSSLVVVGDEQPAIMHTIAHAINQKLNNVGNTVIYTEPLESNPTDNTESLRELVKDMDAGKVDFLMIMGGNPVYNSPVDIPFGESLNKVKLRVRFGMYDDETTEKCQWHVPESHYLESWGDARAYDGTVSIIQPLIAPLYRSRTAHEVIAGFTDQPERTNYDIVRDYWKSQPQSGDFESFWRRSLHDGFISGTALPAKTVTLKPEALNAPKTNSSSSKLEIVFRPDPTIYDGRFANNGWLQELPKPLTKLTWDNAAIVSPKTAEELGLPLATFGFNGGERGESFSEMVELKYNGRTLVLPVWIVPGQADNSITVHLGYGRKRAGSVGTGVGFNAYALRTANAPWFDGGLELTKLPDTHLLACTQGHQVMEGRDLIRLSTFEKNRKGAGSEAEEKSGEGHGEGGEHKKHRRLSMYPDVAYTGYAWGMSIDLASCIGCGACVVACQAENNIPVVGKEQVRAARQMHWLRVDRYFSEVDHNLDNVEAYFQPIPCMQCENAPCEVVCPATATTHSAEGLNDMVYNRCVGTRYCSNNCPYKVRRFNFLQYGDFETPTMRLLNNPDVTVRSRGVMEKCTYCVQRINYARIEAEKENRPIRDGDIVTACQAVCPTEAIVFGNINDPQSRVAKLKAETRNYELLEELNTRPRTTYLTALRNPNPELTKV